ncbi:MAG: crotonase/enoyl-CoA hydratase family protein [Myxococcales bacterium]|nr:crotonase/enoyl-CoA hydratase family protein [Myxococcales bacterium]
MESTTMLYQTDGRVARITLNRPERGNGLVPPLIADLVRCVEQANLDPAVHVIALSGAGKGFCGGYDLKASAEELLGLADTEDLTDAARRAKAATADPGRAASTARDDLESGAPAGSPLDPRVVARNHEPSGVWDSMLDYQMMSRNVRSFMSLFHSDKPVVCKVHGFCVGGGTDLALCSDLLVIAEEAKIGYPPARVWGTPTTMLWALRIGFERAKRLLLTGDCLSGREAYEWGLACECAPATALDERFESLLQRIARMPLNQLIMHKLLVNQSMLAMLGPTQVLGTVFDGIARHTKEGYAFQQRATEVGFRQAVRERDEPFGDPGPSTFKGTRSDRSERG